MKKFVAPIIIALMMAVMPTAVKGQSIEDSLDSLQSSWDTLCKNAFLSKDLKVKERIKLINPNASKEQKKAIEHILEDTTLVPKGKRIIEGTLLDNESAEISFYLCFYQSGGDMINCFQRNEMEAKNPQAIRKLLVDDSMDWYLKGKMIDKLQFSISLMKSTPEFKGKKISIKKDVTSEFIIFVE